MDATEWKKKISGKGEKKNVKVSKKKTIIQRSSCDVQHFQQIYNKEFETFIWNNI